MRYTWGRMGMTSPPMARRAALPRRDGWRGLALRGAGPLALRRHRCLQGRRAIQTPLRVFKCSVTLSLKKHEAAAGWLRGPPAARHGEGRVCARLVERAGRDSSDQPSRPALETQARSTSLDRAISSSSV
jgi:hypothetical protein